MWCFAIVLSLKTRPLDLCLHLDLATNLRTTTNGRICVLVAQTFHAALLAPLVLVSDRDHSSLCFPWAVNTSTQRSSHTKRSRCSSLSGAECVRIRGPPRYVGIDQVPRVPRAPWRSVVRRKRSSLSGITVRRSRVRAFSSRESLEECTRVRGGAWRSHWGSWLFFLASFPHTLAFRFPMGPGTCAPLLSTPHVRTLFLLAPR